ncbi:MAG: 3-deoxy-D-manno-octulosonic acid transferase [Acidobacteria bacterium]|nr:3-deoxy-D-manno-octulosonic acid transferase [Acidobacteriota bacterium]
MYSVYTALLVLYALFRLPPMVYAAWRRGKRTGDVGQRFGRLPASVNPDGRPAIWIHAVSVGETLAARPLARAFRRAYPSHRLILSTTTVTGQAVAQRFAGDSEVDAVIYAPFDLPGAVTRALDRIAPALLVLIDTELWPTLLRACRRRGVRTLVANGRISDRSYRRYRRVRGFMRHVLADVDRICAQTDDWRGRFIDIGADPQRVTVTGNLKFDAAGAPANRVDAPGSADDPLLANFAFARNRPVVMAASTLAGEEDPVLRAFTVIREASPDALLIVAPRHPERFDDAYALAERAGFAVARRSALPEGADPDASVIVLDTMGELPRLFPMASVVFVGGSLVPAGGHNVLEPAAAGRAIVVGPHMENFPQVARQLLAAGGLLQARDAAELAAMLAELVRDDARRETLGAAARQVVEANRGATDRTLAAAAELLPC